MDALRKIDHYTQRMAAAGVSAATAFPPAWRILWSLGARVPPPPFLGFMPLALITGATFGLLFGIAIALADGIGLVEASVGSIPVRAALAGLVFGLFMAAYYRRLARVHGLGSWAAFPEASERA